jgi:hypothetical protein
MDLSRSYKKDVRVFYFAYLYLGLCIYTCLLVNTILLPNTHFIMCVGDDGKSLTLNRANRHTVYKIARSFPMVIERYLANPANALVLCMYLIHKAVMYLKSCAKHETTSNKIPDA